MADFYGTLADANMYHADRSNGAWAGSDKDKTASLVRASTWIDGTYGPKFIGARTLGRAQPLAWPRTGATDSEGVIIPDNETPVEIKRAAYEAAMRELVQPGILSPDYIASQVVKREKVGGLEVEYQDAPTPADARTVVTVISDILASLIGTTSPVSPYNLFGTSTRG